FTPPIWGRYEVANITSYSKFGTGVYLSMVAIALLVVAYYYRDSDTQVADLPAKLRERLRSLGDRTGFDEDLDSAEDHQSTAQSRELP
ncbi:MAG: hypothetical protein ABEJ92_00680, partial [Halobacteriales archaeon]